MPAEIGEFSKRLVSVYKENVRLRADDMIKMMQPELKATRSAQRLKQN
jgi:hypothetical protein